MSAAHAIPTQAIILVGGEGTRLRPVTSRVPKPVAPMVERPFVAYILDTLVRHGVELAIFSTGFLAEAIEAEIGDGSAYGLRVEYAVEDEPLGTAGAIANCACHLRDGGFFVFNGDVLSDVDLTQLAAFHADRGGMGTIFLTPVEDPRRYGLVELRDDGARGELPREAGGVGGHRPHQRRRVRARARGPGAHPARAPVQHRAGRVPPAGAGRFAVRPRRARLLARHRHARELPAGALRHPRGHRPDGRCRSSSATTTRSWRRPRRSSPEPASSRPCT